MTKRQAVKKGAVFLLVITLISALLLYLQNQVGLENIRTFIIQTGPLGPVIYILLIVLTHILAPLQGSPILIAGLAIFGKWVIIYSYLASVISSYTNFWIARKFGRGLVTKLVGNEGLAKIDHIASHEGPKALVFMRLFQAWITDFVSYAAGLTSIKFSTYFFISVLAPIPGTLIFFLLFDRIDHFSVEKIFAWILLFGGAMFAIPPIYYRKMVNTVKEQKEN